MKHYWVIMYLCKNRFIKTAGFEGQGLNKDVLPVLNMLNTSVNVSDDHYGIR